jgi:hypothetical protein
MALVVQGLHHIWHIPSNFAKTEGRKEKSLNDLMCLNLWKNRLLVI